MNTRKALAVLLLVAAMHSVAFADPVPFVASKDNTLYQDAAGQLSNGIGIFVFAGRTNETTNNLRRGLVAFDLNSIPANATVTAATLSLFLTKMGPVAPGNISVNKMSRNWGEGSSNAGTPGGHGAPAQTNDATWLHNFYNTSFWTTPGGDFSATHSATAFVEIEGIYHMWSGSGLLADVQAWVANPASNFGWVVLGNEIDPGSAAKFNTHENSINKPRLDVTFQVGSSTPTPTPTTTPAPSSTPTATPTATASPTATATATATPTATAAATPTGTPIPTPSPVPTPTPALTPTPAPTLTPTPTPTAAPSPAQALNISTRLRVQAGNNVLIGGFIIAGNTLKSVAVRGIGPSLAAFGIPDALADPTLELRAANGVL